MEKVIVKIEVDESGALKNLKEINKQVETISLSFNELNDIIAEQEKITADFRIELGQLQKAFEEAGGSGTIAGLRIQKQMTSLKTAINDNVQSVKKLKIDKAQQASIIKDLKAQQKEAEATAKKYAKTKSEGLDLIKDGLDQISNGAASAFVKIKTGAATAVRAFGLVRTAVISTGIGALLIAVTSLVAFFVKTEKGGQALRVIFAGLGAVVDKLTDVFVNIGEAIFDAFSNPVETVKELIFTIGQFALNPVAAFEKLFESAEEFGNEIVENTKQVVELQRSIEDLRLRERDLRVERSAARKEFAELRSIGQDVTKSDEERLAALEKAAKIEEDLLEEELRIAKERVRIAEEKAELPGDETEALDELADARVELNNIEEKSINFLRESQNERSRLIKKGVDEEKAAIKEIQKAREEAQKAREEGLKKVREALLTENEKEILAVQEKYAELIRLAEMYGRDTIALEQRRQSELDLIREQRTLKEQEAFFKRAADEIEVEKSKESSIDDLIDNAIFANVEKNEQELASDKQFAQFKIDQEKALQNAKLNIAKDALGVAASLAEEGSELAKGLAVSQATISAIQSINSILAAPSTIPEPFGSIAKGISAAAVGVSAFANVKKILAVQTPGGGGGGGGAGVSSAAGPSIPSVGQAIGIVAPNQGQQNIGQQIQQGLGGATIRAYAVGQDISNQQQLDRTITSNGSFG